MKKSLFNPKKIISKLLVILLIFNLFMFIDTSFNSTSYASPIINDMTVNTTDQEISVSGTGDGNGVNLADKPFRYSIGSSQSEWVRDSSNITINEILTSGALSNTQVMNNTLTLTSDIVSGGSIAAGGGIEEYSYRRAITIDHTKIDSELTNFPATIYLNGDNFDFNKSKADGSDIRFTDKNGNLLKFERVSHYPGHIRITTSPTGTDQCAFYKSDVVTAGKTTILEATVKVETSGSEIAGYLNLADGARIVRMGVKNGGVVCNFLGTNPYTHAVDMSVPHVIRMKKIGTTNTEFYLDDVLIHTATYTNTSIATSNQIYFGEGSTTANRGGLVNWYKIIYNTDFNANPDNFLEWNPGMGMPSANGWVTDGTGSLATINIANGKYNVLIPTVSNLEDTKIYLYYGKPNAYNDSIEAWQDKTGKQLTYNGNVKLVPTPYAFRTSTSPTGTDWLYYEKTGLLNFVKRTVVEAKIKIESSGTGNTAWIGLGTTVKGVKISIRSDRVVLHGYTTIYMDTTDDYHIYKIVQAGGTTAQFWIDGTLYTPDYASLPPDATNHIYWGDASGSANDGGSALYEYVKYNLDYDANPNNFVVWNYLMGMPSANGWTAQGTASLASPLYNKQERIAYFDGSGDYFSLPNNIADFSFMHKVSAKWCAEFKIKSNSFATQQTLIDTCRGTRLNSGMYITLDADRGIQVFIARANGTTEVIAFDSGTNTYPNDTTGIHTIKVDYDHGLASNNVKLYVDDVLVGQGTKTANAPSSADCQIPFIGLWSAAYPEYCINGNLVGIRITNGRHRGEEQTPDKFDIDGSDVVFCTNFDTIYDQNYTMVQHMSDTLVDATGNGNNGTATETMTVSTEYGKSRYFDGVNDKVAITDHTLASANQDFTISMLTKAENRATYGGMPIGYSAYSTAKSYIWLQTYNNAMQANDITEKGYINTAQNSLSINDLWTTVTTQIQGTVAEIFKDNISVASNNFGTHSGFRTNSIGQAYAGNYYYKGTIAELRESNIARSDAWIKAESLALKNELLTFSVYAPTGSRESEIYDISGYLTSSRVDWTETKPTGTAITVESNVSIDGGSSWLGWKPCTNGAVIADLDGSQDTSNARLKLRQTLSTSSCAITPILSNSIITIGMSKYVHRISAAPNKEYTVIFEVKDVNGSTVSETKKVFTKAQTPLFTISGATVNSIDLLFSGSNPENTEYQIMCDLRYVNSSGVLTSVPTWITLEDKEITVLGLNIGTMYSFTAKARNDAGEETDYASPIYTGTQGIPVPSGSAVIAATALNNSVTVAWNEIPNSLSYELEMNGEIKNVGLNTYYVHKDLMTGTQHTYRVRGRNQGGFSDWSEICIINTTSNLPLIPTNVLTKASNDTVTVYWNPAQDAMTYTVEIDGMEFSDVSKNSASLFGLQPETSYTYRVKACNLIGESEWSETGSITTAFLPTPKITLKQKDSHEIKIGWNKVEGATSYRIAMDANENFDMLSGSELDEFATSTAITYVHDDIPVNTAHVYRICAESSSGDSAWSDAVTIETLPERPAVPANFRGNAANNFITLIWDAVQDVIGYDIEVDGIVVENNDATQYQYKGLDQYTEHTYRVRAVTNEIQSYWSNLIKVWTSGGVPDEPKNVIITNTRGIASLNWDMTPGAQKYELEVGDTIYNTSDNSFEYRNIPLIENSSTIYKETTYRIRAVNDLGTSDWSGYYVNNAIMGQIQKGKELDLGLTASNIMDFSRYTLFVNYNAEALTVTDLCAYSIEKELGPGMVEGHDIEIVSFVPGHIVFRVNKIVDEGYLWTGIINNIKFTGNATGGNTLSYTAQCSKN